MMIRLKSVSSIADTSKVLSQPSLLIYTTSFVLKKSFIKILDPPPDLVDLLKLLTNLNWSIYTVSIWFIFNQCSVKHRTSAFIFTSVWRLELHYDKLIIDTDVVLIRRKTYIGTLVQNASVHRNAPCIARWVFLTIFTKFVEAVNSENPL